MAANLTLVSAVEGLNRKDLPLADRTLTHPSNANPLVEGEWLEYDGNKKAIRSGGAALSWVVWAEKGRSDIQALGKVPVLYMGAYEADTLVFTATSLALGSPLKVDNVTFESLTRSGLVLHAGGSDLVVGYVTRLPAVNGQKLRFIQTLV